MNKISKLRLKETIRLIVKGILNEAKTAAPKFVYPLNFGSVKNYIRIVKKPETGEFVVYWYENGRRNEDKSYFTDDAQDAIGTFKMLQSNVDRENGIGVETQVQEMTGTGAVSGFNIPAAFSKRGGSSKGVQGSAKLGYELTPEGEAEMSRPMDKLTEGLGDTLKRGINKMGQKLGVELFRTPAEKKQGEEIYAEIKKYIETCKSQGIIPARKDMESFLNGILEKHNMSQDRKQIFWNALSTLRGHMVQHNPTGGGPGSIYGSR